MNDDKEVNLDYSREHAVMHAYRAIFAGSGDAAQIVLDDLRRFCRGATTTLAVGPSGIDVNATMVAEGRREVWIRLCAMTERDPHTGANE